MVHRLRSCSITGGQRVHRLHWDCNVILDCTRITGLHEYEKLQGCLMGGILGWDERWFTKCPVFVEYDGNVVHLIEWCTAHEWCAGRLVSLLVDGSCSLVPLLAGGMFIDCSLIAVGFWIAP